jgi:aminomethyltransferase
LERQIEGDDFARIAGVVMDGRIPARDGYPVWHDGRVVGSICSGSIAPSLDNKNIATALVEKAAATEGARLEIEIRGTKHEATVVSLPFYKRAK